jgi:hypothetical protein
VEVISVLAVPFLLVSRTKCLLSPFRLIWLNVRYRILYFFYGQNVAILAHAIMKEGAAVPNADIDRAIARKRLFEESLKLIGTEPAGRHSANANLIGRTLPRQKNNPVS